MKNNQNKITRILNKVKSKLLAESGMNEIQYNNGGCTNFTEEALNELEEKGFQDVYELEYANFTELNKKGFASEEFGPFLLKQFEGKLPAHITPSLLNECGIGSIGKHVFIQYHNTYYDIETTGGATTPFHFPFIQRDIQLLQIRTLLKSKKRLNKEQQRLLISIQKP